jgi:uncharacterized Zn finger protein (UPF0148 family)
MRRGCVFEDERAAVCGAPVVHPERVYENWCERHRPIWLDNLLEQFRQQLYLEQIHQPRCPKCFAPVGGDGSLFCPVHTPTPPPAAAKKRSSPSEDRDSATEDSPSEPKKVVQRAAKQKTPPPPDPLAAQLPQTLKMYPCAAKVCRSKGMVFVSGTLCDDCNKAWPRGGLDITRAVQQPLVAGPPRSSSASNVSKNV